MVLIQKLTSTKLNTPYTPGSNPYETDNGRKITVSTRLPSDQVDEIEALVEDHPEFEDRSTFIRRATQRLLEKEGGSE